VGVTFSAVFAVIIGVNIGDCLTTYLVSRIGAKPVQRRTAVVHIVYNVFAAIICFLLVFIGRKTGIISDAVWTETLNSGGVANIHGCFRLIPAVLLLPFTSVIERISTAIVKDEPIDEEDMNAIAALDALDERLFTSPALALDQAETVVTEMSEIAAHNFDAAVQQIYNYDPKRDARIEARENLLDSMTDATNKYVVSLSPYVTREVDNQHQNRVLKSLICYERIGDLAVNITNEVNTLRSENKEFSDTALAELRVAFDSIYEIMDITSRAFRDKSAGLAAKVEPLEEVIDDLVEELNARHVYRMVNNLCDPINGIRYQAILTNVEHISDKCSDIAIYIMEAEDTSIFGQEHSFVHELHHSSSRKYLQAYSDDYSKYFNALEAIPATEDIISSPASGEAIPAENKSESRRGKARKRSEKK
jgi:phosphate:Na+ symporter